MLSMGLPERFYTRRIYQIHAASLLGIDILLTDDSGAMIEALSISWAWQIPLVRRNSYLLSKNTRRYHPDNPEFAKRVAGLERKMWNRASHIIAHNTDIAEYIIEQSPAANRRLSIMPSFVDTDNFQPILSSKPYDLIYVGRITAVKNLESLLQAVQRLGLTIAIIGSGTVLGDGSTDDTEQKRLQSIFGDLDGRIHWLGRVKRQE